ncbi:hypothetical protein DL96DRAFT_1710662 [Flagelloscypha sp. PMI_526]|nr:hypothetical protein DL96DRAFT_1710662 [Flagelloscypha sp. PMI_526]
MPPVKFVVRSTEYGDGSEYGDGETQLPDHYQKRLWRKETPVFGQSGADSISVTFQNKDVTGRKISYTAMFDTQCIVLSGGTGGEFARIEWTGSQMTYKNCSFTMNNMTRPLQDVFKRSSNPFGDQTSHKFSGTDRQEYKWKRIIPISMDEADAYWTLTCKDSKHPIATTERLSNRDGDYHPTQYALYLSERGIASEEMIVCSMMILDYF